MEKEKLNTVENCYNERIINQSSVPGDDVDYWLVS